MASAASSAAGTATARATRTATVALPGRQLGRDLARIWHAGRSGASPAYRVVPPRGALTWCGAGDGNRTRIVSLGTPAPTPETGTELESGRTGAAHTGLLSPVAVAQVWPGTDRAAGGRYGMGGQPWSGWLAVATLGATSQAGAIDSRFRRILVARRSAPGERAWMAQRAVFELFASWKRGGSLADSPHTGATSEACEASGIARSQRLPSRPWCSSDSKAPWRRRKLPSCRSAVCCSCPHLLSALSCSGVTPDRHWRVQAGCQPGCSLRVSNQAHPWAVPILLPIAGLGK
jgi:hypothetical protein